ncbi:MAG TPA: archaetidylserine decarboxylase [Burkholderiaceae bacterium]|nr:archaetidylserine decarboxylase [Burkholderiaceae bacterium]
MKRLRASLHWLGDELNFTLTNRIPRNLLTVLMGRFSRIESPRLAAASIAIWRRFSDLDLSDAKTRAFASLHECFTRELVDGARPFDADPAMLASPCDSIVGACGRIEGRTLLQAKRSSYALDDLLCDMRLADHYAGGSYATLRLKADMYHRFHAPTGGRIQSVTYVAGDAWNVNPPALARMRRLFCRNERAVIPLHLAPGGPTIALVPVAAILVASIRFTFIDVRLHLRYRGPNPIRCDARVRKGETLGWFEHGSTLIVLAPRGFELAAGVAEGARLRAGQALMQRIAAGHGRSATDAPA